MRILLAILVCTLLGTASPVPAGESTGTTSGEPTWHQLKLQNLGKAPDFVLPQPDGKSVQLSEIWKDGPVLLDFWATWCGPCRVALPRYEEVYQKYKDQGFTVLAISEDDPRNQSRVDNFVRAAKLTFPILMDVQKEVSGQYRIRSLPTSILIAASGQVVAVEIGYYNGSESTLAARVAKLIADPDGVPNRSEAVEGR